MLCNNNREGAPVSELDKVCQEIDEDKLGFLITSIDATGVGERMFK